MAAQQLQTSQAPDVAWHALSVEEALARQGVDPGAGLSTAEAAILIVPVSEIRKLVVRRPIDEVPEEAPAAPATPAAA